MANFFEGVGNLLAHPVREAKWMYETGEDLVKGKMDIKDIPGSHQRLMNDITVPMIGDNKIAKNSDAIAGAIVGGVLAAPMLAGGGGTSSAWNLGDVGGYFTPGQAGDKWGGLWDSMMGPGDDALGNLADAEAGGAVNANLGSGKEALSKVGGGMDFDKIAEVMKSINSPKDQQINMASHRAGGSAFNPNSKLYENQLLAREYQDLYSQPLYNKLV